MAIKSDSPQIRALLLDIERLFGHPVRTPSDFMLVADKIEDKTGAHISDSTIKRLWIPKLGYRTVSERTLNVLAAYAGHEHFKAYCEDLRSRGKLPESEIVDGEGVDGSKALCLDMEGDSILLPFNGGRYTSLKFHYKYVPDSSYFTSEFGFYFHNGDAWSSGGSFYDLSCDYEIDYEMFEVTYDSILENNANLYLIT